MSRGTRFVTGLPAGTAVLAALVAAAVLFAGAREAAAIDLPQALLDVLKKKPPAKGAKIDPRKGVPGRPAALGKPNQVQPGMKRNAVAPTAPGKPGGTAAKPTGPVNAPGNAAKPAGPGGAVATRGNAAKPVAPGGLDARRNAANPAGPNGIRGNALPGAAGARPGTSALLNARGATRPGTVNPFAVASRARRGPAVFGVTVRARQVFRLQHSAQILSLQRRLPHRPLPWERNFTGVPPVGETRFVSTEMMLQVGGNVSRQRVEEVARRYGLTAVATQSSALTGGTLFQFRVPGGRGVADVVRALEAEKIGVAQPNYVYRLTQTENAGAPAQTDLPEQYAAQKLRFEEAHKLATGKDVLVAVVDSAIDAKHPDFAGAIVETYDATGGGAKPQAHGTEMVGAIAAHGRLTGVAPGVKVLAIAAFSAGGRQSPQATTRNIIAGLEWALAKGARVINMSFTGPYDPMLQVAMKKAHEKGAILIAAAGNQGPKSPPLYPAADPNVIAVTATDENDGLFTGANRGAYVAVATPGVDVLAAAPDGTYEMTTGTSVAAAHASGVAALLIERHPEVDAKTVLEVLTVSALKLAEKAPDDQFGWGLIDPVSAIEELDARIADSQVAAAEKPAAPRPGL
jgi:hypothetical protein